MPSLQFTDADRDERGFVKASAPDARSLADLLPTNDERRTTNDARPPTRQEIISAVVVLPLVLIALFALSRSGTSAPGSIPAVPTLAPVAAAPTRAPVPTTPPVVMLPAYGAPNEAPRWQIEATRVITPTAHYGSAWIQANVAGSGLIWLRAADFPALAIVGPDLAPQKPAAAAPAALPAASAAPEPQPPCVTAGTATQTVTVCDWLSDAELNAAAAAQWVAQYGGNVGSGDIHPTPQPWQRLQAIQNHLANEHMPTEEANP